MWLKHEDTELFSCKEPWEKHIAKVWKLYSRIKDVKSSKEIQLIANLFKQDDKILELEKEIENFKFEKHLLEQEKYQYKSLLDEVKQIIDKK